MAIPPITLRLSREEMEFGPHAHVQTISETFPMHTHDFYEVFLILEGKAIHRVNDQTQLMEKGSLVFMRPSDIHCYAPINRFDLRILNVGLPPSDLETALALLGIPLEMITAPALPIHLHIHGTSFQFLKEKLTELAQLFPSRRCRPLLYTFLCELYYPLLAGNDAQHRTQIVPEWLNKIDIAMENPQILMQGLPWIYSHCNYSQEYIIRSFKRFFHITPTEYINTKKMAYACGLMAEQKYTVTQICFMSGFNNLSHFYHIFESIYHCTPKEFAAKTWQ